MCVCIGAVVVSCVGDGRRAIPQAMKMVEAGAQPGGDLVQSLLPNAQDRPRPPHRSRSCSCEAAAGTPRFEPRVAFAPCARLPVVVLRSMFWPKCTEGAGVRIGPFRWLVPSARRAAAEGARARADSARGSVASRCMLGDGVARGRSLCLGGLGLALVIVCRESARRQTPKAPVEPRRSRPRRRVPRECG